MQKIVLQRCWRKEPAGTVTKKAMAAATVAMVMGWPRVESAPSVQVFQNVDNFPPPHLSWPPAASRAYNHTVKLLGNFATSAECQRACLAYRNTVGRGPFILGAH